MKKLFILFLILIQSFFIGINCVSASELPSEQNHTIVRLNHNAGHDLISVDFRSNENAVLTINNFAEVLSSFTGNNHNTFAGSDNGVRVNEPDFAANLFAFNTNIAQLNKKYSVLSYIICTRAP